MKKTKKKKCTSCKIKTIQDGKGGAPMYYAGIDAHKRTCTITIIDDCGRKIKEGTVMTEESALRSFFEPYQAETLAVVETGLNWQFIYKVLKGFLVDLQVAQAYKLRVIAEAKVKTDEISARTLAHMLRVGYIPQIYIPSEKIMKLRDLIRSRVYLVRTKTRFKNKIHSLLDKNGFRSPEGTDMFGKAGREFLRNLTIGNPEEGIIARYLEIVENLERHIKDLEICIGNNIDDSEEVELLRSIPGIGKISAHLLLAEIGDIRRFRTKDKLCSFAGLCPSVYCSGETERSGHISKQGDKYIRWILTECAQVAARHSPHLRNIFLRIQRKHGSKVAIIAVARQMLEVVFNVLSKREKFSEIKAFPRQSRYASYRPISKERSYIV